MLKYRDISEHWTHQAVVIVFVRRPGFLPVVMLSMGARAIPHFHDDGHHTAVLPSQLAQLPSRPRRLLGQLLHGDNVLGPP